MPVAQAQLLQPLPSPAGGVNKQALLVGGGGAALRPAPRVAPGVDQEAN